AGARAVGRADGAGRPEILDGEERLQALALGERLGAALGAEERPVSGTVHLSPPVPHVPVVPIALAWTVRRLLGGHAGGAAGPVGPLGVEAREHVRQNFVEERVATQLGVLTNRQHFPLVVPTPEGDAGVAAQAPDHVLGLEAG